MREAEVDEQTRQKAAFYVKQIGNAIAPSNFVLTNPELLRETLAAKGENLVRGMQMLAEDIKAGHGNLKIRQSDPGVFEVGRNLAFTPGKVVFQNELFQLLQYDATTPEVLKVPLLILPPWIEQVLHPRSHTGKIFHQVVRRRTGSPCSSSHGSTPTPSLPRKASSNTCAKV